MADDPPYLTVGTEVSAKYKGAFCEAKIRKVVRIVKCKVTFKGAGNGNALLADDQIKGTLRVGANVEAKHPDKGQYIEATINKIQDSSQYTVVFDDGDITTLRRSALCLKSGRHFNESETLDQLPLTHPEHFSNPVVGGRRGVRRRAADKDESSDDDEEDTPTKRDGRKRYEKELDMGKVVCVESTDKKKSKDTWFPALVVSPAAQETVKIRIKDEYLVRSFRDGRYYTVPKKEITEFTRDSMSKYDSNSNVLRTAVEKALSYLDKNELPPHWDREVLFGNARQSESGEGEEQASESEASEDDPKNEEKDRFIAQLYKFMDDRGTPLNKVPTICGKELDLYKIYQVVTAKGGYTKVSNQVQWKAVVQKMGYGTMPSTSTINLVKQAYKKSLVGFEEFYRKLGCTWTSRSSASTSSKSRSSRSIFRDRATPSSSRESSAKDSKKGDDEDGRSTPSKRDKESKTSTKEEKEEKTPVSPPEDDSMTTGETGSECSTEVKSKPPEITADEPRKSSRGRQPKKNPDDEETCSPTRKKRQINPSASKDRDRDSSVASSTKEEKESGAPSSSNTPTSTPGKKGVGRGKYKRHSSKVVTEEIQDEKEQPPKEEEKVVEPEKPEVKCDGIEIRLGDKLLVYYPKSEGKTYEAKVIDINEKNQSFFVHYTGWNNRYDEWIDRDRVSENITLKLEQTGEVDKSAVSGATNSAKGKDTPGAKQRKGRNSSSATSTTSVSSITSTTISSTPSGTRSGSSKGSGVASTTSSSPVSSKRRRSTSTEVFPPVAPAPKRRRTRQKSGQEMGQAITAPTVSDSEPETSDSDGKSIKSDKLLSPAKNSKEKETSPAIRDLEKEADTIKLSKKKGEEAKKDAKSSEIKLDIDDAEDEISSSSAMSNKLKEAPKVPVEDSKDSTTSSSGSSTAAQVLDLDQIRSEMKGLDKIMKSSSDKLGSIALPSVSSPAPPTLSAVVGSSPPPEPTKVDIYEFQEDGSDEAPPSIATSAPKLKMFSPAARSTAPSSTTEKSPIVAASSAEAVAKLMVAEQEKDKPVPLVTMEKMEKDKSLIVKSSTDTPKEPSTKTSIKEAKESVKAQIAPSPKPVLPPTIHPITTTVPPPLPPPQNTPVSPSATSIPLTQTTSSPPVLTSIAPIIITTATSAILSSSTPPLISTATSGPTPVIISSATLSKVKAAAAANAGANAGRTSILPTGISSAVFPSSLLTPAKSPIITTSPLTSPSILIPSSVLTTSTSSITVTMTTASVPILSAPPSMASSSPSTPSLVTLSNLSVSSPPALFQQHRPIISLTTTGTSSTKVTPTPERPTLVPAVAVTVAATVINKGGDTPKGIFQQTSFTARKQELFPHLIQQSPTSSASSTVESMPIPTISIVTSKPIVQLETTQRPDKDHEKIQPGPTGASIAVSISSPSLNLQHQQPIKVAATIPPPPPPPVIKKSSPVISKPIFGPGPTVPPPPIATQASSDTIKQKKKKAKALGGTTTPVKQLAPLPAVGAPPPPPVIVSTPSSFTPTISATTSTPGRKTPVKKRIPPPMDSPGKPIKSCEKPPTVSKPGKMNPEAMNAAIASVGAAPPPPISSVPATVITSAPSTLYPGPSPSPHHGVLFTTGSSSSGGQHVSQQITITKPSPSGTIKSSAESIAASIAAVASMGSTSSPSKTTLPTPTTISGSKGPPMKRFMKDTSDKLGSGNKEKLFSISSSGTMAPLPTVSTPSQGHIAISKPMIMPEHSTHQQQHTPPPITIQAKFQPTHTISTPPPPGPLPAGPAVTFMKTSPGTVTTGPHQVHPHSQSNLPKHPPVIIIPAAPVVIKSSPFQHGPVIVSQPVHIESHRAPTPSSSTGTQEHHQPPPPVVVSAAPIPHSLVKSTMLPITVTPTPVQVSNVPMSAGSAIQTFSSPSVSVPTISVSQTFASNSMPTVELKPVTSVQELPPSITVTKATSVMKSISPDIIAVSSYSGGSKNSSSMGFTPLKQEARSEPHKTPEIVVKPAPASAQIVFHTAADTKKVEVIRQPQVVPCLPSAPTSITTAKMDSSTSNKDPDENSLLCEEIIPGSPTTGEDIEEKLDEDKDEKKSDKKPESSLEKRADNDGSGFPSGIVPPTSTDTGGGGGTQKPVIVLGPKIGEESEDDRGFIFEERHSFKFGDDDDDANKLEERSVDSPMGPPSEGREADLPFRDSFSDNGDQSPPSSPSSGSTISTDDSSRRHHARRLSPTPEGGSSKSKDSDDDDMDSDVGSKSTHLDDADSKHGSTRGSTRIRNQTSRLGRSPSPPLKRRRPIRRNKSPEEVSRYTQRTIRTSSGRKVTPTGRGADMMRERERELEIKQPPPPLINLAKPPKTGKYNFIPNLNGVNDSDKRIEMIMQSINDLKEQYHKTKAEAASFERRVKRWKRRVREKERLARQEATRTTSS